MLRDETIFVSNPLLCLQGRLSEWPSYLHDLFVSSYLHFFKYKFFEVLSLSITIYTPKYYVTKKEPAMFCSANFPRLPRKFHWIILNNFRLSRQEETIKKNKQNKTQQKIDIYVFAFVSLRPKLKEKCRDLFFTKYSVFTSCSWCCVYSRAAFILKLYLSRLRTRLNHLKNFM